MSIMDEAHNKVAGSWKFLRILGSGGFGQVSLWYDSFTGQKIALKKLLESSLKDVTIKSKITERWCNEVEIMKKLDHTNIVSTLEIPHELKMMEPLPVLAMEYCTKGDLRQVLNRAENCCGLCEPDIINILRDVSNGLAYLHSRKIIHRDIKPENIVLQEKNKNTIYKLIDLGYAKALDQNSLSKSFVGTIQYIAPELFMGKDYSSSVDYWSFGLMTHEVITGYRPFLHGFRPPDWMKQIQDKSRSIISAVECANGEVVFNSEISRKNHLTRCFLADIEKWLQLALDWDRQSRGRDQENHKLVIFERLTDIINKKIIKVFSLPTYEILSYEITSATDICDLRLWLKKDTDVDEDRQLLLLPNGKSLNVKGNLFKNICVEELNRLGVSVFLYSSNHVIIEKAFRETVTLASEIRKLSKEHLSPRQLKHFCSDSVYLLQDQAIRYRNFLQGVKIKINNTKQQTLALESFFEDLQVEWSKIENFATFLACSYKTDLESYVYYRKAGKLKTSPFVKKWIENVININSKISELKNSFNKTKQRQLVLLAKKQCQNLDHSSNSMIRLTPLDGLVERGQNFWENSKKLSKFDPELQIITANVVKLIDKSIEESNGFLNNRMLRALFTKISEADENLAKFYLHLKNIFKSMNILKLMIQHVQAERQKEVWNMIANLKPFNEQQNFEETVGDRKSSESLGNANEEGTDTNSIPAPNFITEMNSDEFSVSLPNARSIIEDNNCLRYRIQETRLSCDAMITEMTSLNWNLILES